MEPSPRKAHAAKLQESRQQLEELLSCQICYCRAVQPTLCPHCSKLFCESCLTASLRLRAECPNCRRSLKGPLPQCARFVGEVGAVLQGLLEGSEQFERCTEHGISLNYFCEDCHRSACCECKMFGSHQQHRFTPISQLYQHKYQQIRDLLSQLRNRIVQQEHCLTQTENLLIALKAKTETHIAEIDEHVEKYRLKLQGECEEQGKENVEELRKESSELAQIRSKLLEQLQHAQKTNCYRMNEQLFNRLEALLNKNRQRSQHGKSVPIAEEAMPPLEMHKVTLHNFTRIRNEKQPFFSEPIEYEGSQWRLIVYPSGNTPSNKGLSVFLEMLHNPDAINLYLYCIELIHPLPRLSVSKNHHARFGLRECVGYAKFIAAEELQEKHFVDQVYDTLTFAFGVRFCSYYDLYSRRKTIIDNLDSQIQEKNRKMAQLEEKGRSSMSKSSIQLE